MNKLKIIICLLMLTSCKKEKDIFNYTFNYTNAYPENNASDINLRDNIIRFSDLERTGLAEFVKEYRVYFDTLNPPVKLLHSSSEELLSYGLPILRPNKTYYWAYTLLIPSGEKWSDIQSFTTSDFVGVWKLESVADKKGLLDKYYDIYGGNFDWTIWNDWSDNSYKSSMQIIDEREYISYSVYPANQDSLLNAEAEINEIDFSRGKITLHNSTENSIAAFYYDINKCSLLIQDLKNGNEYKYVTANVGYIQYFNKAVMLLINEDGIMFIYSRV
jgi:hypothetical protein